MKEFFQAFDWNLKRFAVESSRKISIIYLDEHGLNLHRSIDYGCDQPSITPLKIQTLACGKNIFCAIISRTVIFDFLIVDVGNDSEKFCNFISNAKFKWNISQNSMLIMDMFLFKSLEKPRYFWEFKNSRNVSAAIWLRSEPDRKYFLIKCRLNRIRKRISIWKQLKENIAL